LLGASALAACAPRHRVEADVPPPDDARFSAIERRIGGRAGVCALNLETGARLAHRPHERFAMCSTFKWLLGAQLLQLAEGAPDFLSQRVMFGERDLLDYAPATRPRLIDGPLGRTGAMTVEELAAAAVVLSDNTAANLLLDGVGGPEGFTRFLRGNGDGVTRLDRTEPELNFVPPGDERDTTTPDAMVRNLRRFLLGHVEYGTPPLHAASREKLIGWMVESPTGRERLRAGLPGDWRVGDKTGTVNGEHNATNDVAIAWPPGRAPMLIAVYLSASTAPFAERNAAHADIARIIVQQWS
jgi:beta-lactamase class A